MVPKGTILSCEDPTSNHVQTLMFVFCFAEASDLGRCPVRSFNLETILAHPAVTSVVVVPLFILGCFKKCDRKGWCSVRRMQ